MSRASCEANVSIMKSVGSCASRSEERGVRIHEREQIGSRGQPTVHKQSDEQFGIAFQGLLVCGLRRNVKDVDDYLSSNFERWDAPISTLVGGCRL